MRAIEDVRRIVRAEVAKYFDEEGIPPAERYRLEEIDAGRWDHTISEMARDVDWILAAKSDLGFWVRTRLINARQRWRAWRGFYHEFD